MATRIGIRQLVEFVLRSGNLDESKDSQNTALMGAQIHRRLQKERSADYESEVYLKKVVPMNDEDYVISGRADGIEMTDDSALIEEIKTSDQKYEDLSDNTLELYWGQVQVYGYLLLDEHPELDEVTLQLTYFQVNENKTTTDQEVFKREDLNEFFQKLIDEYEYWLKLRSDMRKTRNESITDLPFPFPEFRTGQHEMAAAVYKTICLKTRLFVEAPTGTGKTISTLFPAIKAMGEDKIQRLFYLTAKQSTRHVAEEAIDLMSNDGLKLKSITLTAKEQIRFPEEKDVLPDKNPFMIGYYDRLKPALKDILQHETSITRSVIEYYARKHTIDPFEFSLDTSLFCDVIICDYNYLFDPLVFLQRFFTEKDPDNFFLIDEVHNLVSRSRDMYSVEVSNERIPSLLKEAAAQKKGTKKLQNQLEKVQKTFDDIRATVEILKKDDLVTADVPVNLMKTMNKFAEFMTDWMKEKEPSDFLDHMRDFFFDCFTFVKIFGFYDDTYKTRIVIDGDKVSVKQICLDTSYFLDQSMKLGSGAILFSATLSPMDYYQNVLGGVENSLPYQLPSPFPAQNQDILVTQYISTTYYQRAANQPKIVDSLYTMASKKKGNYLFFFPSYGYLRQIKDAFEQNHPDVKTVEQSSAMDAKARTEFLDQFIEDPDETLVGFCVLGGIFSEGIDLRGDRLIGVAIVSVGLPGLSPENNLIRDYYDGENGQGFAYAYQLPGMNNVLQAAGRLIRSSTDVGVILLLDQRFASQRYVNLFPPHWNGYKRVSTVQNLSNEIDNFWKGQR
ncbi:helicase C-terminal domain-containing protein [Companilactobacillus ginsenosidimutans]|uniref:ATP-dependent helicase n=1 Tax=Companilactobacillus ginsenosidimutans TaxID=1007676 RepID=A0A0H4QI36_9LACO|nr:helicase C-terminal domain-containing protein [Companilactobacillus ginsenosidimutans]AKP67602.1 ATP-dependent helicase [Companilactobacillus ginsenosidimutans]